MFCYLIPFDLFCSLFFHSALESGVKNSQHRCISLCGVVGVLVLNIGQTEMKDVFMKDINNASLCLSLSLSVSLSDRKSVV